MKYFYFLFIFIFSYNSAITAQYLTPAQIVQKQFDAYNQKDVDAFLEHFSDSIKVFNFPSELVFEGKEAMKERYESSFANTPDLHSTLINRTILGNTVIDNEYIIVDKKQPAVEMLVIFKIQDQKIVEMYWIRKENK